MRATTLLLVVLLVACAGDRDTGTTSSCSKRADVARDVVYASPGASDPTSTSIDVYSPADTCEPASVVMWVHGGGWQRGDKANGVADKARLFGEMGYVFVSVSYRLTDPAAADPVTYPTHNEDVAAAVAWVTKHIAEYGGDPDHIALLGHSAGAAIVAAVVTDERYLGQHGLTLDAVACAAPLDTEGFDVARSASAGGRRQALYRSVFGDDPSQWSDASPLAHVGPGKGIPPMLLVYRGTRARRAQLDEFVAAVRSVDVDVQTIDAGTLTHAQVNTRIGAQGDDVMTPAMTAFLDDCFAPRP
ncbi:MAG: alpha/beta hydrolase [Acidimicrobiia bacterium]